MTFLGAFERVLEGESAGTTSCDEDAGLPGAPPPAQAHDLPSSDPPQPVSDAILAPPSLPALPALQALQASGKSSSFPAGKILAPLQ